MRWKAHCEEWEEKREEEERAQRQMRVAAQAQRKLLLRSLPLFFLVRVCSVLDAQPQLLYPYAWTLRRSLLK